MNRDEHLEKTGFARPPLCPLKHKQNLQVYPRRTPAPLYHHLHWGPYLSNPGTQEADAHLPIVIQVGVQAATALGEVAKVGGHRWVDVGKLNVKQVEAIFVRSPSGALDQC